MASLVIEDNLNNNITHITEEDIKLIVSQYNNVNEDNVIESYCVQNASNKMLGFLAEYLKVEICLKNRQVLNFFIKAISRTNMAKAEMVKDMKLFEKELWFYSEVKKLMDVPSIRPWSARFVTVLDDAIVFEDLSAQQYKLKNKFERFDMAHTMQALKCLARFHASSIVFEENRKKKTHDDYRITDDYEDLVGKGGYYMSNTWYSQCMIGALEAMKVFSKYNTTEINMIKSLWRDIWSSALDINDLNYKQLNVVCHRDLWNNNLMFHYKEGDSAELTPDDCLLVDFQATRYQPPASDVMLLLCCNLDPKDRNKNINTYLDYYYEELQKILFNNGIKINDVMTKDEFVASAEEQTKWGLVVCACLIPQFWINDDLTTRIFCDNVQFDEILCKNKGLFIKKMMENNNDYRYKVMEIFEEIADRYCFNEVKNT